jgi:Raf kinase inhibitor-like YbhB/YbcL family protein
VLSGKYHGFAAGAAAVALSLAVTSADAAGIFTLKSTTFRDGQMMPLKVGNSRANSPNPNCVGENVSPELSWTDAPAATKSFILLMSDPQAFNGAGSVHLVTYGIASSIAGFAEGELSKPSEKFVGGRNTAGRPTYGGPCAPPNTSAHHFIFLLIATDFSPTDLAPGMSMEEVMAKIGPTGKPPPRAKGSSTLVGLFINPWHP